MYYVRQIESLQIVKLLFISIWMVSIIDNGICCWGPSSTNLGDMTRDSKILVGDQLAIDCTIFNNTLEYNKNVYEVNSSMISFKFKNKYYPEDRIRIINSTAAQLLVDNASIEDNGMYYCLLNISVLDHNPLVCVSHVTVGYKPQNVKDFKCISIHFRKLYCSWTPQNNPIPTSYHLVDKLHANSSPKYNYLNRKCGNVPKENSCEWTTSTEPPYRNTARKFALLLTGQNQFGTNEQLFMIDHYSIIKPNIPRDLRKIEVTTNNITISWNPPEYIEYDEEVLESILYEVRYIRIDSDNSNNLDSGPVIIDGIRNNTTMTLINLIPFNTYNISIRCKTIQSTSDEYWSEFSSILVTTKSDVPYLAPVLISESFQTVKNTERNRSITLYWKPIPIKNRNAPNFHYSIECKPKFNRKSREINNVYKNPVNVKSENTTYTFNHLDSNTAYIFKIYGVNSEGISKNYSEIIVDKNENIPNKPTNIDVFSYGGGRYEVRWEQPRENTISGPIMNYTVFWCQTLRPRPFPCEGTIDWTHTTNRSIALELPDIKMNYQFSVSANGLKSSSGISWAECIVPIDGRLDKLSEVRLSVMNSTSINVIWKLNCPAQKRVVEGYKISFCKSHSDESKSRVCDNQSSVKVDNSRENHTLTGLEPFSEYKIKVVALTDNGPSDESDPKYAETHESSPEDAPQDSQITQITFNSIALYWNPPLKPNGQISYYEILLNDHIYKVNASNCSKSCSYNIKDLLSYHLYRIQVRACNKQSSCSPYTPSLNSKTLPSVPGQMDPPRTEIINATSVRISWSSPTMPNGPIDYYQLKIIPRGNKTTNFKQFYNISGTNREYILTLDCDSYKDESISYQQQYAVSIVAVNRAETKELVGNFSDKTHLNACLVADENEAYIIGIIAGGTLGLVLFVIVLYMLVRWMKRKINAYNSLSIELPKGLNEPNFVTDRMEGDNAEQFANFHRTDSSPNLMSDIASSVMTDDDLSKNRHGSGISHVSSSSNEAFILPKSNYNRIVSVDSGQHGSLSSNSYKEEPNNSSDSGTEVDTQLHPKDHNDLQRNNKVGPKPSSPNPDDISTRNSDSSSSKDSGFVVSGAPRNKRKKKNESKNLKPTKISALPTTNTTVNPLYEHPFNHSVCIYSLLANSEPSLFDLPIREDENVLNDSTKFCKPEMAKSLGNIIQDSSPNDPNINCVVCDSNNSSTRTPSPNNSYYYRFGVKRLIRPPNYVTNDFKNICPEKKNQIRPNNGYITVDSIPNNSDQNSSKLSKNRSKLDRSQNSYDAEASSTSSNDEIEQNDSQLNLYDKSSDNLRQCEKIQNNSLSDIRSNGDYITNDSFVNPLINCSNSSSLECESSNEMMNLNTASENSIRPNTSLKNNSGYVPQHAFNCLSQNKFNPNIIKNSNGYVSIGVDRPQTISNLVPNNIVNDVTQV